MKNLIIFLLLAFSTQVLCQEKINWVDNIEKGFEIAKTQDKDVLLYFGMDKCVPCRMIDKYAFTQEEFIIYSRKYVMVKIYDDLVKTNVKHQDYIKTSKKEYNIESVPTIVIIKEDGTSSSFFAYIKSPKELIDQIESQY